jgi:hypothetical protein
MEPCKELVKAVQALVLGDVSAFQGVRIIDEIAVIKCETLLGTSDFSHSHFGATIF